MGFKLALGDSEKREVRTSSELGTFMKEFCTYTVALGETLFYVGFARGLFWVSYSVIINRADFFFLNSGWFLLFQVRRSSFKLCFS